MGYAEHNERLNPLTTDLYQLTMSQGFFDQGMATRECSYYLHWRTPAFKGTNYTTVAGLEEAVDYLKNFKFKDDDIAYLRTLEKKGKKLFSEEFLTFLKETPLQLDIDALPEGQVQTTPGPVIRVKGPLYQCQLVESALLNIMNRNSMIATRASLLHEATGGAPLAAFGLRRASELDASSSRSAYIGGCGVVADVDAGRRLGIPVTGTMAHAWMMNFQEEGKPNVETELTAFKAFLKSYPQNSILLVDTYEPKQGIENAIRAAIEMNVPLDGVRLDSGDLVDLAYFASKKLEAAKAVHPDLFKDTKVFMTDGLDETKILALRKDLEARSQAEDHKPFPNVLAYGVGTELQNPGPLRGGVYKVSAHEIHDAKETAEPTSKGLIGSVIAGVKRWMEPVMKLAGINPENPALPSSKASIPGVDLDVVRLWKDGKIVADIVVDQALGVDDMLKSGKAISLHDNKTEITLPAYDKAEPLLKPIFRRNEKGVSEYVYQGPEKKTLYNDNQVTDLAKVRQFHLDTKAALPEAVRGMNQTQKPVVLIDPRIQENRLKIIAKTTAELLEERKPTATTAGDDLQLEGGQKQTLQA
ncbi:MAG: nicotinate phosphoribosyltransferase [Rickettsiales bacterium]|nr:nicotinate phosphoribosyltransferase [Rickettsiales bacterium]